MKKPVITWTAVVACVFAMGLWAAAQAFDGPDSLAEENKDLRNAYMTVKPSPRNPLQLPRPIEFEPIPQDSTGGGRPVTSPGLTAASLTGMASSGIGKVSPAIETERDVRRVIRNLD